ARGRQGIPEDSSGAVNHVESGAIGPRRAVIVDVEMTVRPAAQVHRLADGVDPGSGGADARGQGLGTGEGGANIVSPEAVEGVGGGGGGAGLQVFIDDVDGQVACGQGTLSDCRGDTAVKTRGR